MTKILSEELAISRREAIKGLQQRIRSCRLCEEHGYIPKAQPLVSGRPDDRIMVVGQAPGHRSIAKGRSFSGPGGTILQKWLEQAGLPPGYLHSSVYLSAVKRYVLGRKAR
jgi:uracil-DNA glycosylase